MMRPEEKIEMVRENLRALNRVAVAFSGGKDSFFLLKIAVETLGKKNVTAFFVESDLLTGNDKKRVDYFKKILDFDLERMALDIYSEERILKNARDRCYHCKKKIFSALKEEAARLKIKHLLDGTTYSDLAEYRPGLLALEELGIVSPLKEAGITSAEVVACLESLHIEDFFLTSSTCLATRFPYNHRLDKGTLQTYAEIETYLADQGIYPVRIRYLAHGIRIETEADNFLKLLQKRAGITRFCKERGMKFITLDLEGLKSGVWD